MASHLDGLNSIDQSYCFATIQNITDRHTDDTQTDRQTTQCAKGMTHSTVGQKVYVSEVVIDYWLGL